MTGTPAGVGAIVAGDKVTGGIDGLGEIHISVGQPIVRRRLLVLQQCVPIPLHRDHVS